MQAGRPPASQAIFTSAGTLFARRANLGPLLSDIRIRDRRGKADPLRNITRHRYIGAWPI